jgi:hypothetical protein
MLSNVPTAIHIHHQFCCLGEYSSPLYIVSAITMDNVRIEEEDIKFRLLCRQLACRSGARMEVSKIEFEEMDVILARLLSQLVDSSLGLFFAPCSQVDLCIVFRDSLRIVSVST